MTPLPLQLAATVDLLPGGLVRIGGLTLDTSEARSILVRLAEVVGAAEHAGAWPAVRTMLAHTFAAATPAKVRMVAATGSTTAGVSTSLCCGRAWQAIPVRREKSLRREESLRRQEPLCGEEQESLRGQVISCVFEIRFAPPWLMARRRVFFPLRHPA